MQGQRLQRVGRNGGIFVLLAMVGIVACGGGSESDVFPTCIEFVADESPAPGYVVMTLDSSTSSCELLMVDLIAQGIDDILALDLTLGLSSTSVARFDGVVTGVSLLSADGAALVTQVDDSDPQSIEIGVTRQSSVGMDADSNETRPLIRLRIRKGSGSGTVTLSFVTRTLRDSQTPPQPIVVNGWGAGGVIAD